MKRLAACILFLCLFPAFAMADAVTQWTCPNCGREGLTRNFCGTCGNASPAPGSAGKVTPVATPVPITSDHYTTIGNVITYGHYEQDNNAANGQEPIEWIVLDYDAKKKQVLVISKYGLDARQYHNATPYPTWEKSDIRAWLNKEFLASAFTLEERRAIVKTKIKTPNYNGNKGGNDVTDQIWLLSREEVAKYFPEEADRKATPTRYAVAHGTSQYSGTNTSFMLDSIGCCWWWLRSPGILSDYASRVRRDGSLYYDNVSNTSAVARPAFWLDLSFLGI